MRTQTGPNFNTMDSGQKQHQRLLTNSFVGLDIGKSARLHQLTAFKISLLWLKFIHFVFPYNTYMMDIKKERKGVRNRPIKQ
jgi:hypothetical protein